MIDQPTKPLIFVDEKSHQDGSNTIGRGQDMDASPLTNLTTS